MLIIFQEHSLLYRYKVLICLGFWSYINGLFGAQMDVVPMAVRRMVKGRPGPMDVPMTVPVTMLLKDYTVVTTSKLFLWLLSPELYSTVPVLKKHISSFSDAWYMHIYDW